MNTQTGHKIIYKIRGGSHLYGLNTSDSDLDYLGIFLNNEDELYGLHSSDVEIEDVVSKDNNGKNTKEAIDCKYYSLSKFCNLAMNSNPSILEMLFADDKNIIYCDEYGKLLRENASLFISQKAKHSYLGYALSQKQKAMISAENYDELKDALEFLELLDEESLESKVFDFIDGAYTMSDDGSNVLYVNTNNLPNYIEIGDLKFSNVKLKEIKAKIIKRLPKSKELIDGILFYGVDFKSISHTVRLLLEGLELLQTGKITFPLKDRNFLMSIKQGTIKNFNVNSYIEDLIKIYNKMDNIIIPNYTVDKEKINNLLVTIYKSYFNKK